MTALHVQGASHVRQSPDAAASWPALEQELDRWAAAGRRASLWWRDDDAGAPSLALDRLLGLAARHAVPLALAVIPARATWALGGRLAGAGPVVAVVQHGWDHGNRAPDADKQSELGDDRPAEAIAADLRTGWLRLQELFGVRALPVMVPPWNRIGEATQELLPQIGYIGVSTFGPRKEGCPRPPEAPFVQVNTHIDIIDWHGTHGFIGEAAALGPAIAHLAARREGRADPDEPTGLMTHHLNHDEACWRFLERYVALTRTHPGADWPTIEALFGAKQAP